MTRNVGTFLRHLSLIFTNDKPVEMVLASDYDALAGVGEGRAYALDDQIGSGERA